MPRSTKKIQTLGVVIVMLSIMLSGSCERDDICPAETLTTPRMIVRFYDKENPEIALAVNQLKVYGLELGENQPVTGINRVNVDSIALPLRSFSNRTTFVLIKDSAISDGLDIGNKDTLYIDYDPYEVFVNRACGYKSNYELSQLELEPDDDNWISTDPAIEIIQSTVETEFEAHVRIYH